VYASPTLLFAVLNRLGIRAEVERESAEAVRRLKAVLEAGPAAPEARPGAMGPSRRVMALGRHPALPARALGGGPDRCHT
jgi:hypothetical protein